MNEIGGMRISIQYVDETGLRTSEKKRPKASDPSRISIDKLDLPKISKGLNTGSDLYDSKKAATTSSLINTQNVKMTGGESPQTKFVKDAKSGIYSDGQSLNATAGLTGSGGGAKPLLTESDM